MNVLTTYVRNVFDMFFSVCGAMGMGLRTLTRPSVTINYPRKEEWDVPDGSRMKLYNNIDDCIGCYKCSRICPTDCIEIETIKAPDSVDLGKASTGNPLNFWVPTFDIDMVKCCYCDLCTTVCPTECLVMTKAFEGSAYDRGNLIYHFGNVDSEEREEINELLEEDQGGGTATAPEESAGSATETESGSSEQPSSIMGKLVPESLEGLPVRDRIKARLISRGKLDEDLPEGVELDESRAPAGIGTATEETGNGGGAPSKSQEETSPEASAETATSTETKTSSDATAPAEEEEEEHTGTPAEEGDTESTGGYERDPDQPLRDRVRNRLEARGKL